MEASGTAKVRRLFAVARKIEWQMFCLGLKALQSSFE
jgi:hypothetical protein